MQHAMTHLLTFCNYLPYRLFTENVLKALILLDFLVTEQTLYIKHIWYNYNFNAACYDVFTNVL